MQYRIEETVLGIPIALVTNDRCFSPQKIDAGTLAMLTRCEISNGEKILDLGCGYGVVGIICAKLAEQSDVVMSDNDANAISLAKENARRNNVSSVRIIHSDGFEAIDEKEFELILCNPPYHTDFSVAKHFIEKGFNRLKIGGRMVMVTKRLEWYKRKFIDIFGGVKINRDNGYFVFEAVKTDWQYSKQKRM